MSLQKKIVRRISSANSVHISHQRHWHSLSGSIANFEQCLATSFVLNLKIFDIYKRWNRIVKTRKIKVKSLEYEEIIMATSMTKTIATKIIIIIMMRMRRKIGNHIKV